MVNLKEKPYYLNDKEIEWVEKTLQGMSVRDKVGQLFCEIVNSAEEDNMDRLFSKIKPGAIMFRPIAMEKTHNMIEELQNRSDIPMLIAGNLERGGNGACLEGTYYGAPMQIAATDDKESAYRLGLIACKEGAALGYNWSFEPIIDIDYNPMSPITNTRTFGSDPETIRKMAKEYTRGAHEAGVAVTLKHWPGDGKDFRDQHMCSSVNSCTVEEWDKTYRRNYQELIDYGADTIMAAHIRLPKYSKKLNPSLTDEQILPGSLSYELTTTLLRDEMGFNGVVVSDATQMAGFTMFMPRREAVPASIAAGVDMFLFTICYEEDVDYMLEGVKNGVITEERLNEAVTRILGLKASLKLPEKKAAGTLVPSLESAKEIIGCELHRQWARECADKAITLVKNKNNVLPISTERNKRILFRVVNNEPGCKNTYDKMAVRMRQLLEQEGFEVTDYAEECVPCLNVSLHSVQEMKDNFDLILYYVNVGLPGEMRYNRIMWKNGMQFDVPKFAADIPEIMVSVYNPYHLMDAQMVQGYVNGYSPTETVVEEIVKKLVGKSEFKGKSPVDAFCGLWDTRL